VKRLPCDCSFVTVFEDANGNPLDVGRKQRVVSTPLAERCTHAIAVARFRAVTASVISTGIT
jgi:hypothetical protein